MPARLYVGNLSFDATADDLREIFGQCGEVEDAIIVTRPSGGRPRGFGFVTIKNTVGLKGILHRNVSKKINMVGL